MSFIFEGLISTGCRSWYVLYFRVSWFLTVNSYFCRNSLRPGIEVSLCREDFCLLLWDFWVCDSFNLILSLRHFRPPRCMNVGHLMLIKLRRDFSPPLYFEPSFQTGGNFTFTGMGGGTGFKVVTSSCFLRWRDGPLVSQPSWGGLLLFGITTLRRTCVMPFLCALLRGENQSSHLPVSQCPGVRASSSVLRKSLDVCTHLILAELFLTLSVYRSLSPISPGSLLFTK